jgi:hypothetical protein
MWSPSACGATTLALSRVTIAQPNRVTIKLRPVSSRVLARRIIRRTAYNRVSRNRSLSQACHNKTVEMLGDDAS